MNCIAFESALADYLDGTLSMAQRVEIEQHAAACPACREFMAEASAGASLLSQADDVAPPAELITRIAYLAPAERIREPFERQGLVSRWKNKWLRPMLQPRLAMGMAMTILSFAMLERCTGVRVQRIQPADLNPVRVWSGVEGKALRVKDQVLKYYDNLRIVYEIETHLRDLEEAQDAKPVSTSGVQDQSKSPNPKKSLANETESQSGSKQ